MAEETEIEKFMSFKKEGKVIKPLKVFLPEGKTMVGVYQGIDPEHPKNWFIIDAISNPGNSGCPLIDIETNKVIGVMTIAFRTQSKVMRELDIREPMHIAGARPINLAKSLLK